VVDVRRLQPGEWEILRQVRLHALQDAPDTFGSSFAEEDERPDTWWQASIERLAWFVAEDHGVVVGLVAGLPTGERPCPEVISMWVDPRHRGSSVATQLLDAVLDWARAAGAPEVALGVAEDNDRARRFYERAGFRPTGAGEPLRSRPTVRTLGMRLRLE
jgi:ribosomal protein S18 acetylase RimI-like enzyme